MAWMGVITNGGKNAMEQYIAGIAQINFNAVKLGSGITAEEYMRSRTALQNQVTTGSIQNVEFSESGTSFRLGFGSYGTGYTLREVGLFADVTVNGTTSSIMMALWQESNGVAIPDHSSFPDFIYVLTVVISILNSENLTVTMDPDAFVSRHDFDAAVRSLAEKVEAMVDTIYPVGSIYVSTSNANPGTLFQNTTWAQLKNTFLVGASGDNDSSKPFPAGGTGGKSEYAAADMPKHTHGGGTYSVSASGHADIMNGDHGGGITGTSGVFSSEWGSTGYPTDDGGGWRNRRLRFNLNAGVSGNSGASGSNDEATILPPYLAVYMWKRIA